MATKNEKSICDILRFEGVMSKGFGMAPRIVMRANRLSIEAKAIYCYFQSFAGSADKAFLKRETILDDKSRILKIYSIVKELERSEEVKIGGIIKKKNTIMEVLDQFFKKYSNKIMKKLEGVIMEKKSTDGKSRVYISQDIKKSFQNTFKTGIYNELYQRNLLTSEQYNELIKRSEPVALDEMDEAEFNAMLEQGYQQVVSGDAK